VIVTSDHSQAPVEERIRLDRAFDGFEVKSPSQSRSAGAEVALDQDADGLPVAGKADAPVLLVRVPPDVEGLRAGDPAAASRWRHAVREVLGGLLAEGATVTGFARPGCYVVRRQATPDS
jgi:predicted GNAT superfamily acetyltransferase